MTTPKKLLGAAAFCVALAGGGVAGAIFGTPLTSGAESTTSTTAAASAAQPAADHPRLDVAATALGMSGADLEAALQSGKTIAQVATDQGVDVNSVIDALVAGSQDTLRSRITAFVNGDKAGRRQGQRPGAKARRVAALGAVSDALGMSKADVRSALQGGQTIAALATAHGVDPQTLIDSLVSEATAKIDAKVASGDLTSDRAATMKSHLVERITAAVNGQRPQRGRP
jgi:uncharacterized protein YidB (DUF937 family)